MDLTRKGLGTAWRDYDESFRKARELSPEEYPPEDRPPQMLWMGVVASGVAAFRGEGQSGGDGRVQLKRKPALPAPNPMWPPEIKPRPRGISCLTGQHDSNSAGVLLSPGATRYVQTAPGALLSPGAMSSLARRRLPPGRWPPDEGSPGRRSLP